MDLAEIIRTHSDACQKAYPLSFEARKVMEMLTKCRTSELGSHLDRCGTCGWEREYYNSCRNRHCPKCGSTAREKWLLSRKRDLLPVVYFHVVLTLPDELNPLVLQNKREIYAILFRAGSETLLDLGRDPRHLGGQIGFIAMLHTWGQNLLDHPHLHCIMPCGGLSEDGKRWIHAKRLKNGQAFFVHADVISDLFKKKFLAYFRESCRLGRIRFCGKMDHLQSKNELASFIRKLYKKKWVTYCKEALQGSDKVIDYLGRYAYRVAISENRIIGMENGKVTFSWKDYRDGKKKRMSLDGVEFIRRFLLHVLPDGFFKIRYYGILSSRNVTTKLKRIRELLQHLDLVIDKTIDWRMLFFKITGRTLRLCSECGMGVIVTVLWNHSPPIK